MIEFIDTLWTGCGRVGFARAIAIALFVGILVGCYRRHFILHYCSGFLGGHWCAVDFDGV